MNHIRIPFSSLHNRSHFLRWTKEHFSFCGTAAQRESMMSWTRSLEIPVTHTIRNSITSIRTSVGANVKISMLCITLISYVIPVVNLQIIFLLFCYFKVAIVKLFNIYIDSEVDNISRLWFASSTELLVIIQVESEKYFNSETCISVRFNIALFMYIFSNIILYQLLYIIKTWSEIMSYSTALILLFPIVVVK